MLRRWKKERTVFLEEKDWTLVEAMREEGRLRGEDL